MEARLQSVLNQIYGSTEQSSRGGGGDTRGRGTSATERESFAFGGSAPQHLSTDEFRMQVYKVVPCTRRGPHSWVECSYAHPGEKAARRCPQRYAYVPVACPTLKREGRCPQGDSCCFAHNLFEYWLHPARYRTQLCSYGAECKRSICFFAHHAGELRITEYTNQLLALEKELEASDPTYATSNAKWGINSATAQQPGRPRQSSDGRAGPGQHRGHGRPNHQPQQQGSEGAAVAAAAAAQMAQLRQLQALQAQGAASLSHQALLNALAAGAGAGSGYSSHVSPTSARNAAAAAMLEAALQQQQQQDAAARMAAAQGNAFPQGAGGSHRGTGQAPLDSQQMAAAMKMLSNMSLAGGGTGNPAPTPRLQPYNSVPAFFHAPPPPPPQLQPHGSADSNGEAMQALQLIAQLQQLAGRPGGNAAGTAHLQSTLMQSLPQLLMQMGGNAPMMGGPSDHNQRQHQLPAHLIGQLQPSMSLPPYFTPAPPAPPEAMPAVGASFDAASLYGNALKCTTTAQPTSSGSPSPANALSVRTRHTGGSSASSQLSDGTRSPPMSHHSDEGIWAVREEDRAWRRASAGSGVEPLAHAAAGPAPAPEPEWHGQAAVAGDAGPFSSLTAFRAVEGDAAGSSAAAVVKRLPLSLDDADLGMGGMSDMAGASAMIASLSQLIDGPGQA